MLKKEPKSAARIHRMGRMGFCDTLGSGYDFLPPDELIVSESMLTQIFDGMLPMISYIFWFQEHIIKVTQTHRWVNSLWPCAAI